MRSTPIWRASLTYLQQAQAVSADAFNYFLPKSHIATAPLRDRSASKLLVVRGAAASLETKLFSDLPSLLPADSLVVRNTSRVIPARLPMLKRTGGRAEVMLLSPVGDADPTKVLQSDEACTRWNCFIGGRRIKEGDLLQANLGGRREWKGLALVAKVAGKDGRDAVVDLSVQKSSGGLPVNLDVTRGVGGISLNEAISQVGRTPLPPYIPREDKPFDRETYQTVYATTEGSVAAPTAGLHVTEGVMEELRRRGVRFADVLLHVGAGTFAPVGGGCAGGHAMHEERTVVAYGEIEAVLRHLEEKKPIIALGTTSVRTLESLYWLGVRLLHSEASPDSQIFSIDQWDPYVYLDRLGPASLPTPTEALTAVLSTQTLRGEDGREHAARDEVVCKTKLLIVPGYPFQLVHGLITNFHQPRSTLLMLVSAFLGPQKGTFKDVYRYALGNNFRFLSYGDSSLYLPESISAH